MERVYWSILIGVIVIAVGCYMLLSRKKKQDDTGQRPYEERNPEIKKLSELPIDEIIIVVGFTSKQEPIVQFVSEFQIEMRDAEGKCFILRGTEHGNLLKGKTYEIIKADNEGTILLQQVALLITADYIC